MTATKDHFELNAMLNLYGDDGKLQLHKDREAARQYFHDDVNKNTVFFHSLQEKLDYLVENNYYEKESLEQYSSEFIEELYKLAYSKKFRFESFVGAYKYYSNYTLKTFDGLRYLERYEDRICSVALYLAQGNEELAKAIVEEVISSRFQPATPTFLNAGKAQRGELVSCFLLRIEDNMNSISRAVNAALQLSKRGGGVAFLLSNLRERGAPIKMVENQAAGIVPVMKMFEDAFSYANQLGARPGAGAVYLSAHHPDIMAFLDTKRENADEKVRIKTLSIGVCIPDITFELAKEDKDMYLFSPYDVERVYGIPFSDISVTEKYHEMVENPKIRKSKVNARGFFQRLAELQFESGYPYIKYEDTVNRANPIEGRINMSNLCVAPETLLLTDRGEYPIAQLAGQTVNVYNGEEFTETVVEKTGDNQKLLKVTLSDGRELECTEYHKWYLQEGYPHPDRKNKVKEVRTHQLVPGDRLIKWKSPTLSGYEVMNRAYLNGFYSGDGTQLKSGSGKIYLYGDKQKLQSIIGNEFNWYKLSNADGVAANVTKEHLSPKFTVPTTNHTLDTRLLWLAGFLDADGSVYRNGDNEALTCTSINREFLGDVQSMLLGMGVHSKIALLREEGMNSLPTNDGKGTHKEYFTRSCYRLLISSYDTQRLLEMGLKLHRLTVENRQPNRSASGYVTVVSVEDEGRHSDTYCVTEKNRGMAVFNGILTGNCSEILQVNTPSEFNEDLSFAEVGKDISCNLGSMNIAKAMESPNLDFTVETAIRALTTVSQLSNIACAPSIQQGNNRSHAIGLGQMNLHGFLAKSHIHYGSEESLDFVNLYFYTIAYYAYKASNKIAIEEGVTFDGFERSEYATGEYFKKYTQEEYTFRTQRVQELFDEYGMYLPTQEDWKELDQSIRDFGLYHSNLQAVPPTGSISYINNSTASIHPIAAAIEKRKEGKLGRVYYPAPYLNDENFEYYKDAYEIGYEKIIDVYAEATKHVDQGLSLTLFFRSDVTTRDLNRAQIYAWKKGIKTLYYIRIRQDALEGTEVEGCVACAV